MGLSRSKRRGRSPPTAWRARSSGVVSRFTSAVAAAPGDDDWRAARANHRKRD